MNKLMREMLKATGLTRRGSLIDATRLIQRALGIETYRPSQSQSYKTGTLLLTEPDGEPITVEAAQVATPIPTVLKSRPSGFAKHDFVYANEQYAYRLYVPASSESASSLLPVVVMLHGCKQDAADFASGTSMNALAEQKKCLVVYPEQRTKANGMRCWNWFEPAHQKRDSGEPGMVAALIGEVLANLANTADPTRVYICGLSAGGAMAALIANLYPELFAAVGVHSGLPSGAASDAMSAFKAMRSGAPRGAMPSKSDNAMPTIVFHGGADKTVYPVNGDDVVNAALNTLSASGVLLEKLPTVEGVVAGRPSRRRTHRTIYRAANGKSYVEYWTIQSGPHAWSGGSATGSYTDPQGPDASCAMLEFFLQHHK